MVSLKRTDQKNLTIYYTESVGNGEIGFVID